VEPIGSFIALGSSLGDASPLLADNIDPQTHDFASLAVGQDPVDAQVILALSTVRASGSAVLLDGINNAPSKMDDSLVDVLAANARQALQRLVSAGDIQVVSAAAENVDPSAQQAALRVRFVNLRSGQLVSLRVPLPAPRSLG